MTELRTTEVLRAHFLVLSEMCEQRPECDNNFLKMSQAINQPRFEVSDFVTNPLQQPGCPLSHVKFGNPELSADFRRCLLFKVVEFQKLHVSIDETCMLKRLPEQFGVVVRGWLRWALAE
jgi:hypothetical protein